MTDAEKAEYEGFWLRIISQQWPALDGKLLWHYTTGEGLINILKSGRLWATQVSCLNDRREFVYGLSLVLEAFQRRRWQWPGSPRFYEYLLDTILSRLAKVDDIASTVEWFVTCFSSERDDLSQWRAYCGGENGYAIGFDAEGLFSGAARNASTFLAMVDYDPRSHLSKAELIVAETVLCFQQGLVARDATQTEQTVLERWTNEFLKTWAEFGTYATPVWKDEAFRSESEWRVVHRLQPNDVPNPQFQQKTSLMSRHLPIAYPPADLALPEDCKPCPLPIKEILVGPARNPEVSRISVGDLLSVCDYPKDSVPVRLSRIPFRSP